MKRRQMLEPVNEVFDCQLVLESLMVHLPAHLYWKNANGVYVGCNDRQAKSLGLSMGEEVIGKTDFDLPWHEKLAKNFWENDRQVLLTGISKTVEEVAIVDGIEAIVWSLKVPLKTLDEKIVGVLGISIDITEQKRAEAKLIQAKESVEAAYLTKTQFWENMRHDIRTPISGIRGCIQLLQYCLQAKKLPREKIAEYLEDLDISSGELLSLLNKMAANIQAIKGSFAIKKERFNLERLTLSLLKLNQARAKQKGLNLSLKHDERIPTLIGDGERIERIILELLTNALNFTQQGEVSITTELAKQEGTRVIIKIQVEDTGIGMSSDKLQAIFTRLPHLSSAYQGLSQGTGLGLSLIKQILDELEGEIYVASVPGKGAKFTCVLPLKAALLTDQEQTTQKESTVKQPLSHYKEDQKFRSREEPIHVLLVEDDFLVRKITLALLVELNCKVVVAKDGESALTKANKEPYELILLDIGLPDRNGDEVARAIRQDASCCNQAAPIVAVTAHVDHESKKAYHLAGINVVLSKPLSEETIREVLQLFVND